MFRRVLQVSALVAAMGLLGCQGCQDRTTEEPTGTATEIQSPERKLQGIPLGEPDSMLVEQRLIDLAGEIDVENRYASTVRVKAKLSDGFWTTCAGVAIGRQLVLTAGHCVCERRTEAAPQVGQRSVIDTSRCAASATVETFRYLRWKERGQTRSGGEARTYEGKVRPHPLLEVVLEGQGRVTSSRADLALIRLDKPLEADARAVLAEEDVRVDDAIIIVGFGYDEISDYYGNERRFSVNKVARLLEPGGERVLIAQPGGHLYRSDSGGPCFRAGARGLALVGISSRNLGEGATFTSTYRYRKWLLDEVRRTKTEP